MMGTSMPLAFRGMFNRNVSRLQMLKKVTKRTIILFIFGVMISNAGKKGSQDLLPNNSFIDQYMTTFCFSY